MRKIYQFQVEESYNFKSVRLHDNVEELCRELFYDIKSKFVKIPNKVTVIPQASFVGANIQTLEFGQKVEEI